MPDLNSTDLAFLLRQTIERELPHLREADDERVSLRPKGENSWSAKQELGHLIDSASNNHQRFVRAALETEFAGPGYAQDAWVSIHGYQNLPWERLVSLWFDYNVLLAALIENIPSSKLETRCIIGSGTPVTLQFVIEDYVKHTQHHVDHILAREFVTPYR